MTLGLWLALILAAAVIAYAAVQLPPMPPAPADTDGCE